MVRHSLQKCSLCACQRAAFMAAGLVLRFIAILLVSMCKSCLLISVCLIRYMQSFVELLDYENRKPEDPHTLNE